MNWKIIVFALIVMLAAGVVGILAVARAGKSASNSKVAGATVVSTVPWMEFKMPSDKVLRERLSDLQYRVTQKSDTEAAFQNTYWDNHASGIYVDIVSGEPLFSSMDKFDSGTGWPSFTRPLVAGNVVEHADKTMGMRRVEVRSKRANSHLGHVFEDGPAPNGLRYCMNSAALAFVPVGELKKRGYGDYLALFPADERSASMRSSKSETATFAGGCFWGMEDILRDIPGVLDTEVGYTGGQTQSATYQIVHDGQSGHAEAVRVVFDPEQISYEDLLGYFFRMHDPTTENRQGNDRGTQYRSAIFYYSEQQREIAEHVKEMVDRSGKWNNPVVTQIVPAGEFHVAEDYHQDYLVKHPSGYTCHYLRD